MRTRHARRLWAAPCSLVGLGCAGLVLLLGGRAATHRGTLEVTFRAGPRWREALVRALPFRAITFGHVVIAAGRAEMEALREHERVHVRQYERWGLAFFPAYLAASAWQWLRGRRAYWDNPFEVEARRRSGEAGSLDARR